MDDEQFTREPKTDILLSLYQMVFREHYPEIKNSFKTGIGFGFANNFISLAFVFTRLFKWFSGTSKYQVNLMEY